MRFRLITLFLAVVLAGGISAQQKDKIVMAEYPGGQKELQKYLEENIVYPTDVRQLEISGEVVVEFFVERTGVITNINVVKGLHPDLDNEAKRVVKNMPNWRPARKNGVPARCKMSMPINFKFKHSSTGYLDKSHNVK